MITQEDIDAMEDGMGKTVNEWAEITVELMQAKARIEQLERELGGIRAELDPQPSDTWPTNMAVRALQQALAAEKALSDRLAASYAMSLNYKAKVKACPSLTAYRKARGL